ncbi:hypothetical protein BOW53_02435 [Solemya pervernicosa gill symbiont]|uniref:Response regulatory domain-containing protein n=2 Tax=Gammaproteobacteria incertae sedis TaxID=118884 RepID=A0A1T2L9K0_9GAMM|nr:response regulator [Candidatus Reidiella endopervernicosa]OOZ41714.1 hypothetical protein BOW53_02435 [Solemya pervernicosa gill symbiont]QKQ26501.1 response regulator [Candidatus Reidiella endopervernicosa]
MPTITIDQLSVLLVEPSGTQERIIRGHLNDFGIPLERIQTAQNGSSALQMMRGSRPDLAISAMYLPDMTGTDLVEAIHTSDDLHEIGYILISSETNIRVLEPIRQAGAIAILPKPYVPEQLKTALYTTLDVLEPEPLDLDDQQLTILLVDDSLTSRRHIRRMLEGLGVDVIVEAENGNEAMGMINEQFFDAIVTDYNMPEMDGKELIDHIRNSSSQPGVPILMITSEQDNSRLAAVEQAGVSAICDKPFDPETIRSYLKNALI